MLLKKAPSSKFRHIIPAEGMERFKIAVKRTSIQYWPVMERLKAGDTQTNHFSPVHFST